MKNKSEVNHNSLEYPTISHFWLYLHFWIFSKHSETCRVRTSCQIDLKYFMCQIYYFSISELSNRRIFITWKYKRFRLKILKTKRKENIVEIFECLHNVWPFFSQKICSLSICSHSQPESQLQLSQLPTEPRKCCPNGSFCFEFWISFVREDLQSFCLVLMTNFDVNFILLQIPPRIMNFKNFFENVFLMKLRRCLLYNG